MSTQPLADDLEQGADVDPQASGEPLQDAENNLQTNQSDGFVSREDFERLEARLRGLQGVVDRNQSETAKFLEQAKNIGLEVSPEQKNQMLIDEMANEFFKNRNNHSPHRFSNRQ